MTDREYVVRMVRFVPEYRDVTVTVPNTTDAEAVAYRALDSITPEDAEECEWYVRRVGGRPGREAVPDIRHADGSPAVFPEPEPPY